MNFESNIVIKIIGILKKYKTLIGLSKERVPKSFYETFDEERYLTANLDVAEAVKKGLFLNGTEHFSRVGYKEVRSGKRSVGIGFPYFDEKIYLKENLDLQLAKQKKFYFSLFDHFLRYGYKEFVEGKRNILGVYTYKCEEACLRDVKKNFDEVRYFEANLDVKEAVEKNEFSTAWEHFRQFGVHEVQQGKRLLDKRLPAFNERAYLLQYPDVVDMLRQGKYDSPYSHFLKKGFRQILKGERASFGKKIYSYIAPIKDKAIDANIEAFKYTPLISVVMPVYNIDVKWLSAAIDSLKMQWYENWELCIADDASTNQETIAFLKSIEDPRIKIKFLETNKNISIASNQAFSLTSGEYIALMDHDDELTEDALYEVVRVVNETDAEFVYSDEDKIEMDGSFSEPHFKPDFSPEMFLSQNYLSHLGVIKKSLVDAVGGWTAGLEGSQDYDLYLKVLEKTEKIEHIPKVLYHWRKVPGSTAAVFSQKSYAQEAGRLALENAMQRRSIDANVFNGVYPGTYRVNYKIKKAPLVSIVIPFKDRATLLEKCIGAILEKSTYKNFEIIGMNNNSVEKDTVIKMQQLSDRDGRVKFYAHDYPFNFSAINNFAVQQYANGDHIVLLNNDVEIITPDWLEALLEFSQRDNVGAVGAKLYYMNDTIQHAGLAIGVLKLAGHSFRHLSKNKPGYMGRESVIQNVSGVTAACLMVKKSIYEQIGGMNEKALKVAFNDVDFCLRLREAGFLNVYTPYCEAYHYESLSRGQDDTPEKKKRFLQEVSYVHKRHKEILSKGDPYYSKHLTLENENFGLR